MRPGPRAPTPFQLQQRRDSDRKVLTWTPFGETKAVNSTTLLRSTGFRSTDRLFRALRRLMAEGKIVRTRHQSRDRVVGRGGRYFEYLYHRPSRKPRSVDTETRFAPVAPRDYVRTETRSPEEE